MFASNKKIGVFVRQEKGAPGRRYLHAVRGRISSLGSRAAKVNGKKRKNCFVTCGGRCRTENGEEPDGSFTLAKNRFLERLSGEVVRGKGQGTYLIKIIREGNISKKKNRKRRKRGKGHDDSNTGGPSQREINTMGRSGKQLWPIRPQQCKTTSIGGRETAIP